MADDNPEEQETKEEQQDEGEGSLASFSGELSEEEVFELEGEEEEEGVLYDGYEDYLRERQVGGVLTEQHLKDISHELGLIKLCWEDVPQVLYDGQQHYPLSYMQNSKKEKLLLWYAENFRQQFCHKYPNRRPLLIACDNECGIQKMVSTTIRPTNMKFPEFQTWQGCAAFVSEFLKYEVLQNATVLPDHIKSPQTVLKRQAGHCFEFATVLASILIASGYDAYVVFGYATREICLKDQSRLECPFLQDEPEVVDEEEEVEDSKYFLKKPVVLKSQFLAEMEAREIQKQRDAERAQEQAELDAIKEFEKPPPDELWSWRLHSWIVILPSKDVTETFFIESTTGIAKKLDDPDYHGIESIWNHQNYFVLVQFKEKTETCANISFNLKDTNCWERFLIGEPINLREMPPELLEVDTEEFDKACIEAEKHLDMPHSWVDQLQLSHTDYERRFPSAKRVVYYRKAVSEQFSPYSQSDGLVERVTRYDDYDCRQPRQIREKYAHRSDFMYFCERTLADNSVLEKFERGREDGLKERFYYSMNTGIEVPFTLQFYSEARLDGLCKLVMDPLFMTIYFDSRADLVYYFHVDFAERTNEKPMRAINRIIEKFHRNPDNDADKDVAVVEYRFAAKELYFKFHYEDEHVTQSNRKFIKPTFAERGVRLTFDPDLTSGYLTGPIVPPPKPLYLYRLEVDFFKQEEIVEKKTRDREDELLSLLRLRSQELAAPRFLVSVFDVERNEEAKKAFKEQLEEKKEMAEREMELSWDYLSPYYAKLGLKPKIVLPLKTARQVAEECLKDWKDLLIARANEIQLQFEQSCQEFKDRNNWFEQNQSTITKEQEEEYFEFCKRNSYFLHILEVRLNRHKERAPAIFKEIQSCLRNDPRLELAYRPKRRCLRNWTVVKC